MADPAALPQRVRLFPLSQTVLLPRAIMTLNIFEPRYLAMTSEALEGDCTVAMIQPRSNDAKELYAVGTTGRIIHSTRTEDGRILIELKGVRRFHLVREVETKTPWREAEVDYSAFAGDDMPSTTPSALSATERAHLEEELKHYLDRQELSVNWDSIRTADDESLVATLATACPFHPAERQALLEAAGFAERVEILVALMRLAGSDNSKWVQ